MDSELLSRKVPAPEVRLSYYIWHYIICMDDLQLSASLCTWQTWCMHYEVAPGFYVLLDVFPLARDTLKSFLVRPLGVHKAESSMPQTASLISDNISTLSALLFPSSLPLCSLPFSSSGSFGCMHSEEANRVPCMHWHLQLVVLVYSNFIGSVHKYFLHCGGEVPTAPQG